jgi:predicted PurR-regulated permease PerM
MDASGDARTLALADQGALEAQADAKRLSRGQRFGLFLLATAIAAASVWTLHRYVASLVWAAIFAIALWPLHARLQRHLPARGRDMLAPLILTLAVALLFLGPLGLLATQVAREATAVTHWVQDALSNGIPVPQAVAGLPLVGDRIAEWWQANLASPEDASRLAAHVDRAQVVTYGRLAGVYALQRAVQFGFMLLALFFLFRDGAALAAQMRRGSRRAFGPAGERVGQQMIAAVHGTVDGLVLVGLGEGLLIGIGYAIAGVPHPVLFGAVTAVAAMLPFCAPLAFGAAALLLLAQGSTVAAGAVLAWGFVVTFVADHAIRPVLIGGATRLPFLLVLLGILGGVETWGLLGLFLGPALMAAITSLWRDWTAPAPAPAPA